MGGIALPPRPPASPQATKRPPNAGGKSVRLLIPVSLGNSRHLCQPLPQNWGRRGGGECGGGLVDSTVCGITPTQPSPAGQGRALGRRLRLLFSGYPVPHSAKIPEASPSNGGVPDRAGWVRGSHRTRGGLRWPRKALILRFRNECVFAGVPNPPPSPLPRGGQRTGPTHEDPRSRRRLKTFYQSRRRSGRLPFLRLPLDRQSDLFPPSLHFILLPFPRRL